MITTGGTNITDTYEQALQQQQEEDGDDDDDEQRQLDKLANTIAASTAEERIIRKVYLDIKAGEQRRIEKGLNTMNFSTGVMNCFLITYVFGAHPEHFWLLYMIEFAVLVPLKIYHDWQAKPLKGVLYYADYCWVMSFLMNVGMYMIMIRNTPIPSAIQDHIYLAVFGIGCGPLLGATAVLPFCAVVFHDVVTMTGLFIHLVPSMMVYTLLWHGAKVEDYWHRFGVNEPDALVKGQVPGDFFPQGKVFFVPVVQGLGSVVGNCSAIYVLWLIPFCIWMLTVGMDMPKYGYDTAFHSNARAGWAHVAGAVLWKRPKAVTDQQVRDNTFERGDFVMYMVIHSTLVWLGTVVLGYVCLHNKYMHAAMLWLIGIITVVRGANRYVYWVTCMSSSSLKKEYKQFLSSVRLQQPLRRHQDQDKKQS